MRFIAIFILVFLSVVISQSATAFHVSVGGNQQSTGYGYGQYYVLPSADLPLYSNYAPKGMKSLGQLTSDAVRPDWACQFMAKRAVKKKAIAVYSVQITKLFPAGNIYRCSGIAYKNQ